MSETNSNQNAEVTSFQLGDYIIDIPKDLQDKVLINDLFQESAEASLGDTDCCDHSTSQSRCCNVMCESYLLFGVRFGEFLIWKSFIFWV